MNDQKLLKEIIKDKPKMRKIKRPRISAENHAFVKQLSEDDSFSDGLDILIKTHEHSKVLELENSSLKTSRRMHENDDIYRSLFGVTFLVAAVLGGCLLAASL